MVNVVTASPNRPFASLGTGFAQDPSLPARDRLLDERAMAAILGEALELSEARCRLVRVKYRLGESIRASYEVSSHNRPPLRISLRGFTSDRFDATCSSAEVVLANISASGWIFPGDRKLTSLRRFWNEPKVRQRALGADITSLDLVAYAPEKAATIRCGAAGEIVGFAKLYAGGGAQASIDIYRQLGSTLDEVGVCVPDVRAFDEELGLVALAPAAGETIASRHEAIDWYRLGGAAARLHGAEPLRTLPRFERNTMTRLRMAGRYISAARPDVTHQVERLLEAMERARDRFESGPDVLLHGDLHAKNVLCTDHELTFIDLDQAAIGPAAGELGSAIAALRYDAMTTAPQAMLGGVAMPITPFETHLLEGYRRIAQLPSSEALDWHVAAALFGERSLRAVNRVRLDGLARLPLLLQAALDTVDGGQA